MYLFRSQHSQRQVWTPCMVYSYYALQGFFDIVCIHILILQELLVISDVKTVILDDLLTPMQSQFNEIINNVADKEKALKEATAKEKELECHLSDFNTQYSKVYQS